MNRIIAIISLLVFASFPLSAEEKNFTQVRPGYEFSFPRDHGAHNGYETEWWYFTGHLKTKEERTFGFELTFFKIGIEQEDKGEKKQSKWHVDNLFLSHFAITDDQEKEFLYASKFGRPSLERAGASEERLQVWIDDWSAEMSGGVITLNAKSEDKNSGRTFSLRTELKPSKDIVLHGDGGYSVKGEEPGQASYYMTFSRLLGDGVLMIGEEEYEVSLSAWMDQEVVGYSAASEKLGWDWFAVQLDNNEEIMLFHLRDEFQNVTRFSSGTYIRDDGTTLHLTRDDFKIQPTGKWKSEKTGITYPSSWELTIPKLEMNLTVTPTVKDQELSFSTSGTRTYWEGRSLIRGIKGDSSVTGAAYVELVGY